MFSLEFVPVEKITTRVLLNTRVDPDEYYVIQAKNFTRVQSLDELSLRGTVFTDSITMLLSRILG